jgi:hypothetical protein
MLGLGEDRVSGGKLGYKRCMQELAWKDAQLRVVATWTLLCVCGNC